MINDKLVSELLSQITGNKDDITNIKNGNIYSTSEVKTNKVWIDGKPIYRKVIDMGTLGNMNTETRINHNLSNYTITNISGGAFKTDNTFIFICGFNDEVYVSSTKVIWNTKADRRAFHGYVIIEYIKNN